MRQKVPGNAGARRTRVVALVFAGMCVVVMTPRARAALDLNPLATVSVLHNSNVFARPADQPPFATTGNTQLGDTITRYLVGATADFAWERDKLSLSAQGSRFDFNRFTQLNHYENKFAGAFEWRLGTMVDGNLNYSQGRSMAPLADTLSEQLEIQTEKLGSGVVKIRLTPRWRLDLLPNWHELESPLPAFPRFGFKEGGVGGSINYLGTAKLTAGLREDYLQGAYHHIVAATKYHQNTTELTASYAISGFSAFEAQAGYTQRHNSLINSADTLGPGAGAGTTGGVVGTTNAFTGALAFRRQISVKTSLNLRVFREVNTYVAGANSEIGTGGEAGARWDPDLKLSFTAHYRYSRQSIQGALAIANFTARTDTAQHAEFGVEYHALRWLTVRPYALRDTRSSNFHEANYNSTVVGVDFTAQLHPPQ
jgi:hypothetical protein